MSDKLKICGTEWLHHLNEEGLRDWEMEYSQSEKLSPVEDELNREYTYHYDATREQIKRTFKCPLSFSIMW